MQDELIERCAGIPGAAIGDGAFGPGPAVWAGRREVAHVDADGSLDVRLTRQVIRSRRAELRADGRVTLRGTGSDWLRISASDVDFAIALVADAVAANLPTAPPGLPPSGADLDRRRRFH